jgi:hypothetical protein
VTLARRPFTFLAGRRRRGAACSSSSRSRRRSGGDVIASSTPCSRCSRPAALDFAPDVALFGARSIATFPEVRRVVDELYAELARTNAAADAAFEKDARVAAGHVLGAPRDRALRRRRSPDSTGRGPRAPRRVPARPRLPRHRRRPGAVRQPRRRRSPRSSRSRAFTAPGRGASSRLAHGEEELVDFLVERVRRARGQTRRRPSACASSTARGRVTGVVIDGEEAETGVGFVVTDHSATRALLDLTIDFDPPRRALVAAPQLWPGEWRFVLSIVVRDRGAARRCLGDESFLAARVAGSELGGTPRSPSTCSADASRAASTGRRCWWPKRRDRRGNAPRGRSAREAVLATLERCFRTSSGTTSSSTRRTTGARCGTIRSGERKEVRPRGASCDRVGRSIPSPWQRGGAWIRRPFTGSRASQSARPSAGALRRRACDAAGARTRGRASRRVERGALGDSHRPPS